jgi:hypothetical protein
MIVALWAIPAFVGLVALLPWPVATRRALLAGVGVAHAAMVGLAWVDRPGPML